MPKSKYRRGHPRRSERMAIEVYRRHGNDLGLILKAENIHLREEDCWWKELLIADEVRKEISLNRQLKPAEKRGLIAHALGHYFLHGGNRFYFAEKDPTALERDEQEAWEFAAYLLLPEVALPQMIRQSPRTVARTFHITEDLVRLRWALWIEDRFSD